MTLTALVVEDHPIVREMIAEYVRSVEGVELIGTVGSAEEALAAVERHRPGLLVVDLSLPGMSGIELVEQVLGRHERTACLVLTGHAEPMYRERVREMGAHGFVLKDDPDELLVAIASVRDGARYEPSSDTSSTIA